MALAQSVWEGDLDCEEKRKKKPQTKPNNPVKTPTHIQIAQSRPERGRKNALCWTSYIYISEGENEGVYNLAEYCLSFMKERQNAS